MNKNNESQAFIKLETMGANLLLGATILALIFSNSPWHNYYEALFAHSFQIQFGHFQWNINIKFIVNEILMVIFFLVATLEIKYEFMEGALNSYNKAFLPIIAAIGGMIFPAIIYIIINYHHPILLNGWAIPTATDIAFSLGVLSLLGSRIIPSLKVFLTTLAIIDDLIAIIIIAFFYTNHLSIVFLVLSGFCLCVLYGLNKYKVISLLPYIIVGIVLWYFLFLAGIHPTIAGVALAFSIPLYSHTHKNSPLHKLKALLHPGVALIILPLFAFANAGVPVLHITFVTLQPSIIFGILISLFVGKQFGIFITSWVAVKLGMAHLPKHVRWIDIYAISILCGIGFTISLFIGSLAFAEINHTYLDSVKIGVLSGSILSGLVGFLVLFFTKNTYYHLTHFSNK